MASKQTNRHLKLTCSDAFCDYTCRCSRGSAVRFGLPEHCGEPMTPDDVAFAVEVMEPARLERHPEYRAELERWSRRAEREHRGANPDVKHPCPVCHKYKRAGQDVCACGYSALLGRYVETTYGRASDDIPF